MQNPSSTFPPCPPAASRSAPRGGPVGDPVAFGASPQPVTNTCAAALPFPALGLGPSAFVPKLFPGGAGVGLELLSPRCVVSTEHSLKTSAGGPRRKEESLGAIPPGLSALKPVSFVFFIIIIIILFYIRNLNKISLALVAAVVCRRRCAGQPWRCGSVGACRMRAVLSPRCCGTWGLLPTLLGCFLRSPAAPHRTDGACRRRWSGPSHTGGTQGTGWSGCRAAPQISWVLCWAVR